MAVLESYLFQIDCGGFEKAYISVCLFAFINNKKKIRINRILIY